MKKTILLLCGLLCASGAFAQQVPTTDRKKEPTERQKRIREQAKQAKQTPVKTRATAKKDPNTIDTQDPGTDAVLNSTTGGRNAPKAATKKDSVAVPQAR